MKDPEVAEQIRDLSLEVVNEHQDVPVAPESTKFSELCALIHQHPQAFSLTKNASNSDIWARTIALVYFRIMEAERAA